MIIKGPLVQHDGKHYSILREYSEWGITVYDLASPPKRFWSDQSSLPAAVEPSVDSNRVINEPLPSALLDSLQYNDNWSALSRRSIARLWAYFLVCEDPQRRLDAREVSTLAHQMSLVRHILDNDHLKSVLIADEVGLGKTVEAGLILKELVENEPGIKILYLAPARLVRNVIRELYRLGMEGFRQWTAGDADARMSDRLMVASIHRAVHGDNLDRFVKDSQAWDVIIVDECHHLSDWAEGGGGKTRKYQLVEKLIEKQRNDKIGGRVILMSGTPHQGHESRFVNLLSLLKRKNESKESIAGRVIYRTKEDIKDWYGHPLFPKRQVNEPIVIELGSDYQLWLKSIFMYFKPEQAYDTQGRAGGWRCAQALQWTASSPQAGLGYLIRQALRAGWNLNEGVLKEALELIRPYRNGADDEQIGDLYERMRDEVYEQDQDDTVEDIEEDQSNSKFRHDRTALRALLEQGVHIIKKAPYGKWDILKREILDTAGDDKIVLFAQPIETVTALKKFIRVKMGIEPAVIIGGQDDSERDKQIDYFRQKDGTRYLISSRAGGEGINLQIARRLVHLDVPWNPMELEQRIGRVHRFGSTRTVIVDTLVTKDSREERAFAIARQKLKLIAGQLGGDDRFEMIFSRVMCLVPPESLQGVILDDPFAPFTEADTNEMAQLVNNGFKQWNNFHEKFSAQQKAIRALDPGLVEWSDVAGFLKDICGASVVDGIFKSTFHQKNDVVVVDEQPVDGFRLNDESVYIIADQEGEIIRNQRDDKISQLGLNKSPVASLLRKFAFPYPPCGAAFLRWPKEVDPSPFGGIKIAGGLVFLKQVLKPERGNSWVEIGNTLLCYVIMENGDLMEISRDNKGSFLRALFKSIIKKTPDDNMFIKEALKFNELRLCEELRRPSDDDIRNGIRYVVVPLLASIIHV